MNNPIPVRITPEQAIAALDAIAAKYADDPESAHALAEQNLLQCVPVEVHAAYERVVAACGWWAYDRPRKRPIAPATGPTREGSTGDRG